MWVGEAVDAFLFYIFAQGSIKFAEQEACKEAQVICQITINSPPITWPKWPRKQGKGNTKYSDNNISRKWRTIKNKSMPLCLY